MSIRNRILTMYSIGTDLIGDTFIEMDKLRQMVVLTKQCNTLLKMPIVLPSVTKMLNSGICSVVNRFNMRNCSLF